MFTGIVKEVGTVAWVEGGEDGVRLVVEAAETASRVGLGDSVSIGGVCLTVVAVEDSRLAFDAVPETLRRTSLGALVAGAGVNLEPALGAGEPMGGHVVQGHVDGTGEVTAVSDDGFASRVEVRVGPELARYVVEHGSVALDGVSLTVARLADDGFEVSLIPETLERTTLSTLEPGSRLNVEVDVIARYAERLLQGFNTSPEGS